MLGWFYFLCSIDFIQEAKNSERATNNFKSNKMVKIPFVYWVKHMHFVLQLSMQKFLPSLDLTVRVILAGFHKQAGFDNAVL